MLSAYIPGGEWPKSDYSAKVLPALFLHSKGTFIIN